MPHTVDDGTIGRSNVEGKTVLERPLLPEAEMNDRATFVHLEGGRKA
jgi:hypothetical protein